MHYLITGGAGFIGSHLADYLLAQNHRVTVLDDLSAGSLENLSKANNSSKFEFVQDSVRKISKYEKLISKVDGVFHLAAAVGVKYTLQHPEKVQKTNEEGTLNVLQTAANLKKRIVITSSSEVYQFIVKKTDTDLLNEEMSISLPQDIQPRWKYAVSKFKSEVRSLELYRQNKLPVSIARLFNVVGTRQRAEQGMVIPNFVESALQNKPIIVHGDGNQKRSFTHVLDTVRALGLLMESDVAIGEVVNIGAHNEVSILELAEKIRDALASSSEIIFSTVLQDYGVDYEDIIRRVPDISKLRRLTGFTPSLTLDAVIDHII